MSVVAVTNQKGGVGKTTTVVNLAAALKERGCRVLLVDNDPQGNLALALGAHDPESFALSLGDLLVEHARNGAQHSAADAIFTTTAGLDLLPSNTRLSAAELILSGTMGREMALRDLLAPVVDSYDYVLIDCLPSLGLLAINALTTADQVLIPVQADYLALQGVAQVLETISAVRAKLNPELQILGAVLTMMDVRTAHARGVAELLRSALDGQVRVFDVEIRAQVALKDSAQEGMPVLNYRPDSQAAQAYRQLAAEILGEFVPSSYPVVAAVPEVVVDQFPQPELEMVPSAPPVEYGVQTFVRKETPSGSIWVRETQEGTDDVVEMPAPGLAVEQESAFAAVMTEEPSPFSAVDLPPTDAPIAEQSPAYAAAPDEPAAYAMAVDEPSIESAVWDDPLPSLVVADEAWRTEDETTAISAGETEVAPSEDAGESPAPQPLHDRRPEQLGVAALSRLGSFLATRTEWLGRERTMR